MKTYQEVVDYLNKKNRTKHLLLGNGFSMAYSSKIFSYNALSNFVNNTEDPLLKRLFEIIKTKNFELVMQQLDNFCELAKEFSVDPDLENKIQTASELLKTNLVTAITALHPEYVYEVPEKNSMACANFLKKFLGKNENIFTTNYDILLYWTMLRHLKELKHCDGFGRYLENEEERMRGEDALYSELIWGKNVDSQNVHYLHGALPIFDTGIDVIKAEYEHGKYLLSDIKERIEKKTYPVFVTAGNGDEKLSHIRHNQYLSFCYDRLCEIDGSIISFGFGFGKYDEHIIDALNKAFKGKRSPSGLRSIYIGVYSDSDMQHVKNIEPKFKCKVNMYDAKTVDIWGHSSKE